MLSVGGTIYELARSGVDVEIVTVFAGDPDAETPPSCWDATRGEVTQGAAVRSRRREDQAAAAELEQQRRRCRGRTAGTRRLVTPMRSGAKLGSAVKSADLHDAAGWPLRHADHSYTTMLVLNVSTGKPRSPFTLSSPTPPTDNAKGALRNRTVAPLRHAEGQGPLATKRLDAASRDAEKNAPSCTTPASCPEDMVNRGRWGRLVRMISRDEWLGNGARTVVPPELGLS